MTVYGEEHIKIDVSKGLFISPAPDSIPDGCCQKLVNLLQNERGNWEMRKGMQYESPSAVTDATIGTTLKPVDTRVIPEVSLDNVSSFGSLYGNVGIPQLWFTYYNGTNQKILHNIGKRASTDTVNTNTQQCPTAASIYDMVQYKERVYGITVASLTQNNVYSFSGWKYDGTAPNLTQTLISLVLTSSGTFIGQEPGLVVYGDRLFIYKLNRLIYTDIPASGGYPETWNSGNNFINLPSSNTGSPTIYNCIAFNGLLYIFTDKGIFVLNGRNATPTTWSVDLVTDQVCILNRHAVQLVNGIFIITDRKRIVSFDGQSIHNIGAPVQYLFNIYNSFSVVPFLKGFILSCRNYAVSGGFWAYTAPTGGNATIWPISKAIYFDGSVWSEFRIGDANTIFDPIFGATNKGLSNGIQENMSYIICHTDVAATPGFTIMYYDVTRKDDAVGSTFGITVNLTTKDIIAAQDARNADRISRIKTAFVKVFSLLATITTQWYKNGASVAINPTTSTLTDQADNNYELKIHGAEFNSRVSLEIVPTTGATPTTFGTDLPSNVPIFEIKDIVFIYNSDRDEPDTITT